MDDAQRGPARLLRWLLGPAAFPDAGMGTAAERVEWLVRLRWFALAAQLVAFFVGRLTGWLSAASAPSFGLVLGGLAIFNVATGAWLKSRSKVGEDAVALNFTVDIVCLALLLVLSGGADNHMSPIMFLHASLGPALLRGWRGPACLLLLLGAFATVHFSTGLAVPPALSLASRLIVCALVWAFTWWLIARLAAGQTRLAEMQQRQSRLDRLRAVGALAAGFSHRFATPLNTLQMRLERLGRRRDLEEDADLGAALEATGRCAHVLERMVGVPLRTSELRVEPLDMGRLVERICDGWSGGTEAVEIEIDIAVDLPRCPIPELAFTQSLLNLLDNAAESMAGGGRVSVRVRSLDHGRVAVSVLDRGVGWPDSVRDQLGEPFVTTRAAGVGLGLFNAASLAEALGGNLRLSDRPGGGAEVAFIIPSVALESAS